MPVSEQDTNSTVFPWPQMRLPKIRIAVPTIIDGPRYRPATKPTRNNSHRELLDQFRCDMDGFMPQPVARRRGKKR